MRIRQIPISLHAVQQDGRHERHQHEIRHQCANQLGYSRQERIPERFLRLPKAMLRAMVTQPLSCIFARANTAACPSEAVPGKRMLRTCRHKHDKTLPRSRQERFLAFAASSSFGTARRKYHAQGHRNQNVGHGLSDRMYRTYTNGTGNGDDHCQDQRNAVFR